MLNLMLLCFPFLVPLYYSFRKSVLAECVNYPEGVIALMYVFLSDLVGVTHLPSLNINDPEGVVF